MTPGDLILTMLKARGWTQATLAEVLGRPAATISEIVGGKKRVTAATAHQLEAALGMQARVWLMLQADADIDTDLRERERERLRGLSPDANS